MRLLFEGGDYSRAATIRGRRLFEGDDYLRAAAIRGRRLFEGDDYSKATSIRRNVVHAFCLTITNYSSCLEGKLPITNYYV